MKHMLVGLLMVAAIGIGFSFGSSSASADEGVVSSLSDGGGANPASTVATVSADEFTTEQAVDATCGESAFPSKPRCSKTPPKCCCWAPKQKKCVCSPPRKSDGRCAACTKSMSWDEGARTSSAFDVRPVDAVDVPEETGLTVRGLLSAGTYVHRYSGVWYKKKADAERYAPNLTDSELGRKVCPDRRPAKINRTIIQHCKESRRGNGYKCRRRFFYTCT